MHEDLEFRPQALGTNASRDRKYLLNTTGFRCLPRRTRLSQPGAFPCLGAKEVLDGGTHNKNQTRLYGSSLFAFRLAFSGNTYHIKDAQLIGSVILNISPRQNGEFKLIPAGRFLAKTSEAVPTTCSRPWRRWQVSGERSYRPPVS